MGARGGRGVARRDAGGVNEAGERLARSEVRAPADEAVPLRRYLVGSLQFSSGGPWGGEWCDIPQRYGREPRRKGPEQMWAELDAIVLDEGTDWFQASNLEVTDLTVGNPATNVIPAKASARISIRFNDLHTGESLSRRVTEIAERHGGTAPRLQAIQSGTVTTMFCSNRRNARRMTAFTTVEPQFGRAQ